MKFAIIGLFIGILLNLLPVFQPKSAVCINPNWHGSINSIENIETPKTFNAQKTMLPPIILENSFYRISSNGEIISKCDFSGFNAGISGSGNYLIKYEKVGKDIEFENPAGEKFWKLCSMEYPYLSHNGKFALLLNGDQSAIRIVDYNGNRIGAKKISGRFCTVIAFSKYSDCACVGFLDGSFYLIDEAGQIKSKGLLKNSSVVKSAYASPGGRFYAIHHGNKYGDFLLVMDSKSGEEHYSVPLEYVHLTKTALCVSDNGNSSIIDYKKIIVIGKNGGLEAGIAIYPKKAGASNIDHYNGLYTASFTLERGGSGLIVYKNDGDILMTKYFPEESYLESSINNSSILLRGSEGLYCYNYDRSTR